MVFEAGDLRWRFLAAGGLSLKRRGGFTPLAPKAQAAGALLRLPRGLLGIKGVGKKSIKNSKQN